MQISHHINLNRGGRWPEMLPLGSTNVQIGYLEVGYVYQWADVRSTDLRNRWRRTRVTRLPSPPPSLNPNSVVQLNSICLQRGLQGGEESQESQHVFVARVTDTSTTRNDQSFVTNFLN